MSVGFFWTHVIKLTVRRSAVLSFHHWFSHINTGTGAGSESIKMFFVKHMSYYAQRFFQDGRFSLSIWKIERYGINAHTFFLLATWSRRESPTHEPKKTKLVPRRQQHDGVGASLAFCIFNLATTPAETSKLHRISSPDIRASSRVEGVIQEPTASRRSSSKPSALGAPLEAVAAESCTSSDTGSQEFLVFPMELRHTKQRQQDNGDSSDIIIGTFFDKQRFRRDWREAWWACLDKLQQHKNWLDLLQISTSGEAQAQSRSCHVPVSQKTPGWSARKGFCIVLLRPLKTELTGSILVANLAAWRATVTDGASLIGLISM